MSLKSVCFWKDKVKNWWILFQIFTIQIGLFFSVELRAAKQDVITNSTEYRVFAKQVKTALQIVEAKLFTVYLMIKIWQKMALYATDGEKHDV